MSFFEEIVEFITQSKYKQRRKEIERQFDEQFEMLKEDRKHPERFGQVVDSFFAGIGDR